MITLLFTQEERERDSRREQVLPPSPPGGHPILELLLLTSYTLVCVCMCVFVSNGLLSLEQMPLTDVIQLPTETVNKTMNCSSPTQPRPSIRAEQLMEKKHEIVALTVALFKLREAEMSSYGGKR